MGEGEGVTDSHDAIVVGLGAIGSASAYHLAKRGARVLGIEQFRPGHDRGSSHGEHRMIRRSSFSDDGYVPLSERALDLWAALGEEAGEQLLHEIGEVWLVDGDDPAREAGIANSIASGFRVPLGERELAERFPGTRLWPGMRAFYEAKAGFVRSEAGIRAHVRLAERHGAEIRTDEEVTGWAADGGGVRVETTRGSYRAGRLVLAAGCWTEELLNGLSLPMEVQRRVNGWFRPTRPDWWTVEQGAPDFLLNVPEGSFYGIPSVDGLGLKIGLSAGEATTARTIRREIADEEIDFLREVLNRYLPGASGPEIRRITCMCTYTVDSDFIVDAYPGLPQVGIACGMSGRGYKFAPVLGEVMADLALAGATGHDVGFLGVGRFGAK